MIIIMIIINIIMIMINIIMIFIIIMIMIIIIIKTHPNTTFKIFSMVGKNCTSKDENKNWNLKNINVIKQINCYTPLSALVTIFV